MKTVNKRTLRMKLRKYRKDTQVANESTALFLGPKLLGELRILMRLASPSYGKLLMTLAAPAPWARRAVSS